MKFKLFVTTMFIAAMLCFQSFASGNDITSYAFGNVAGDINGTDITVHVPYSTTITYWDHKVQVSDGATFTAGSIGQVGDNAEGVIRVVSVTGEVKEYTVHIIRNDYKDPTFSVSKAKSIRKDSAKVDISVTKNDASIRSMRLVYYTNKNSLSYVSCDKDAAEQEVEIKGLAQDTKYHFYVEIETPEKTYTSSSRSFTTKKSTDSGTSTSSSNSSTNSSSGSSSSTVSGPGNGAKQNTSYKDEWVLENDKWFYYGSDGYSKTGWFEVNGAWYYVTKGTNDLAMDEWKKIGDTYYHFGATGAMSANMWVSDGGKWYFVGPSGTMLHNQVIQVDGIIYSLSPDGDCLSDAWVLNGTNWQYYKPGAKGLARNETFVCDGITYVADENGYVR